MSGKVGYVWHLRRLMAERGLFATTELRPLLAERGVVLSREQVYRLVVRTPALGDRCLRGRTRTERRRPAPALPGLPQDPGGGPGGGGGGILAGNSGRGRYGRGDHQPAGTA